VGGVNRCYVNKVIKRKMIRIYGIKNCDTIKKTLRWMIDNRIEYQFHDYKTLGVDIDILERFIKKFGLETVLNTKSRTWKELTEKERPKSEKEAIDLMRKKTSIIKRPIIDGKNIQLLGFDLEKFKETFGK